MHLNGEKCLNVICREKLAGNGQMDLRLMFLKKFGPQGSVCLSAPTPGQYSITCILQLYLKIFSSETA